MQALRVAGPARPAPAPRLAAATPSGRVAASVVVAAKPTKAADFRSLSDEQIKQEVADGKKALFKLRMAQKTRQEFKGSDFAWNRKKIAQLLTVLRERSVEAGVSKRDARKAEAAEKIAAGYGNM